MPDELDCADAATKQALGNCRRRLTQEQIDVLESEYLKDPVWETKQITKLARRLKLNRTKVYKWHWDRKKKAF